MSTIEKIYARCPSVTCLRGCTACCGPVPVSEEERVILGLKKHHTGWTEMCKCRFASPSGCTVYDKRPLTCRLFGLPKTGAFICQGVKNPPLTKEEGDEILELYMLLMASEGSIRLDGDLMMAMLINDVASGRIHLKDGMEIDYSVCLRG